MYDLFVIGGGSGGVRAARWSASLGAKVALCEDDRIGGTCVIKGCVPKKYMVYGGHLKDEVELMTYYGWGVEELTFNWEHFKRVRDEDITLKSNRLRGMLDNSGVEVINGKGSIIDNNTVSVNGKKYTAKNIIITPGSCPRIPKIKGHEHFIYSSDMFHLDELPESIIIWGGGYIAVEFASIMNSLGVETTVIIRRNKVLRGFDSDIRIKLQEEMMKKGIQFIINDTIREVVNNGIDYKVDTENGKTFYAEKVLCALGRVPNVDGLGIESVGIKQEASGAIITDEFHKTNIDNVYAIGDVTDKFNLTPVATREGTFLAERLFNSGKKIMNYENIPTAVFSNPQIGIVGYSEEEAIERFGDVEVYKTEFKALKFNLTDVDEKTFIKVLVKKDDRRVVGCHMMGMDAPEIIQGMAIAIKAGATKENFDETIGIHPTSAEEFVTLRTPVK